MLTRADDEGWSIERLETFADTVVEAMKADQTMDNLWTGFRDILESAENSNTVSCCYLYVLPSLMLTSLQLGSGRRYVRE